MTLVAQSFYGKKEIELIIESQSMTHILKDSSKVVLIDQNR